MEHLLRQGTGIAAPEHFARLAVENDFHVAAGI